MADADLHYERHAGFDRIKTVNVPPIPDEIVTGLQPYERSVLGYSIEGYELLDDPTTAGRIPRMYFSHRPPTEQMSQIYAARGEADAEPERLTYFHVPGGRTIQGWRPVAGDNLRGRYRKGGAVFGMDLDGSEVFQLWRYWEDGEQDGEPFEVTEAELDNRPGRGRIERLTNDGFKYLHHTVSASRRGRYLVFGSNLENKVDTKVYVVDLSTPGWDPVLVYDNPAGMALPGSFSADETRLIVARSLGHNNIPRFLVDLPHSAHQGPPQQLVLPGVPAEGETAIRSALFSKAPGSSELLLTLDAYGDYTSFVVYDTASNVVRHITTPGAQFSALQPIPWSVSLNTHTAEYAIFTANADGYTETYRYDLASRSVQRLVLPGYESDLVLSATADDANGRPSHLAVHLTSSRYAASVVSVDIANPAAPVVTPYAACQTGAPPYATQVPALIRYKSFDGLEVPAWIYKPSHVDEGVKLPVVVWIHGGPEGQIRPTFRTSLHGYLLNELGIAIIYPNVRGSTGYGRSYDQADDVYKREDSVRDIGALLAHITSAMPDFDAARIAIMGASYGGYMTFACLVRFSHLVRCGVASCGIANFRSLLESTHVSRAAHRRNEYGDERDPKVREFLESISPVNHVDKINVPLFISQGDRDTRVPLSEALMMFDKVRSKGIEAWLTIGEQEGHGFKQKSCIEFVNAAKAAFLKKWLFGEGGRSSL